MNFFIEVDFSLTRVLKIIECCTVSENMYTSHCDSSHKKYIMQKKYSQVAWIAGHNAAIISREDKKFGEEIVTDLQRFDFLHQ